MTATRLAATTHAATRSTAARSAATVEHHAIFTHFVWHLLLVFPCIIIDAEDFCNRCSLEAD